MSSATPSNTSSDKDSKKRSSNKKLDHLLSAPKHINIDKEHITAYYDLIKSVGRASLVGSGYEHASHQKKRLKTFVDKEEDLESRIWDETDIMLSAITEKEREQVLSYFFEQALANKKNLYTKKFSIDAGITGSLPQHITEFAELVKNTILPNIINYTKKLPKSLKEHPEMFLNLDFYNHLKNAHHYLISPNIVESFVQDPAGVQAKILAPSLSYALEIVANKKAPELLNKKSMWRFVDPLNYVPYLSEYVRPTSYEDKYKKSSGIRQAIRKRVGWKNKHLLDEENIAEFNVLNRAYKTTPATLEAILSSARSLYQYHENTTDEYESVAKTVIHNAKKLHVDTTLIASHGLHNKGAYDESNKLHISFMKNLDANSDSSILDAKSKAILLMYKTHHIAMENYRNAIIVPLTHLRSSIVKNSEDNSNKIEGPLVRYGNYFEGTERILNESDNAGFFYHLAYAQKEQFHGYIDKLGSVFTGVLGKTAYIDNLNRWKGILESGGHHHAIVRPNTLGKVYTIAGTELAWWAGAKLYNNLKDNAAFFTPLTAARQVFNMVLQGKWADLLSDAMHETKIPDNPNEVSVDEPDGVSDALSRMRPAYMTQSVTTNKKLIFGLLGEISYSHNPTEELHTKILTEEFVADENNIPTLAAIGMLNVRRKDFNYAKKFLGMTNNWSKRARELKLGAASWDALSSYEMSVLYGMHGEEELREEHLFNAFRHYSDIAQTKAPYSSNTHELETYCLTHPMNYASRLELIKMSNSSYSHSERLMAAHQAYSELETILGKTGSNKIQLSDKLKEELKEYQKEFAKISKDHSTISTQEVFMPKDLYQLLQGKTTHDQSDTNASLKPENLQFLDAKYRGIPNRDPNRFSKGLVFQPINQPYLPPGSRGSDNPELSVEVRAELRGIEAILYDGKKLA